MTEHRQGVFCVEGDWWGDLKKPTTVEPLLHLLASVDGYRVPYIHRNVATVHELRHYLAMWTQRKHADYPILYLGFHGREGALLVGDQRRREGKVTLDWFEEQLEDKCGGRVLYFASCETLAHHGNRLNTFARRTGALAVCGYSQSVEWMESAAYDLLLLGSLGTTQRWDRGGLRSIDERLRRGYPDLTRRLDFRFVISPK